VQPSRRNVCNLEPRRCRRRLSDGPTRAATLHHHACAEGRRDGYSCTPIDLRTARTARLRGRSCVCPDWRRHRRRPAEHEQFRSDNPDCPRDTCEDCRKGTDCPDGSVQDGESCSRPTRRAGARSPDRTPDEPEAQPISPDAGARRARSAGRSRRDEGHVAGAEGGTLRMIPRPDEPESRIGRGRFRTRAEADRTRTRMAARGIDVTA